MEFILSNDIAIEVPSTQISDLSGIMHNRPLFTKISTIALFFTLCYLIWNIYANLAEVTPADMEVKAILQDLRIETAVRQCRERGLVKVGHKLLLSDLVKMNLLLPADCEQVRVGRIDVLDTMPPQDETYSAYTITGHFIIPVSPDSLIARKLRMDASSQY